MIDDAEATKILVDIITAMGVATFLCLTYLALFYEGDDDDC